MTPDPHLSLTHLDVIPLEVSLDESLRWGESDQVL